jgi:hypothetical protein
MTQRTAGWRQGPDGRWYPPVNAPEGGAPVEGDRLAELATLVNSGSMTDEIDDVVKDAELAV